MRMVKGLRTHNAGPETIRRVIHSYVPSTPAPGEAPPPPIPVRRAPGVIAQDARARASDITTAIDAVAGRFDALSSAMDQLSDSLAAFSSAAETMAPKRNRFDTFLGSLERLADLSKRQRGLGA
jgi:ABC-type transporter Mla subunit MlaD